MSIVAKSPSPALFGFEVSDPENKLKSMLVQMTTALRENGVAVAAPTAALIGETPIDTNIRWLKAIQAAMALTNASLVLVNGSAVSLITIASLLAGDTGNSATVAVAAGTASGKKITVVKGVTTEIYDDLANVDAAIAAIHGVSALVSAVKIANGTLANISATNLAGGKGAAFTAPTFAAGENDNQSVMAAKFANALFAGLQTAGYLK